jgi:adenylosuccinate synthase
VLHQAVGETIEVAGWSEELGECRTESDLPAAAREYLDLIAQAIGVPVALVGVGPGREQVIWTPEGEESVLAPGGLAAA